MFRMIGTFFVLAALLVFTSPPALVSAFTPKFQTSGSLCEAIEQGDSAGQVGQLGYGTYRDLQVSPDASMLALAGSDGVWLYDAQSLLPLQLLRSDPAEPVTSIAWAPHATHLAMTLFSGDTQVWDLQAMQTVAVLDSHARFVAWSPDAKRIATVDFTGTVVLWDALTGNLLEVYMVAAQVVAWSPDGSSLAIGSIPKEGIGTDVYIWKPDTTQVPELLGTSAANAVENSSLGWSPDGSSLVVGGGASTGMDIWDIAQGSVVATLPSDLIGIDDLMWSPDGLRIAVGGTGNGGNLLLWNLQENRVEWFEEALQTVTHIAWSPNGEGIYSLEADSTLRLWNAADGQLSQVVRQVWGNATTLVWSPDDTKIAVAYLHTNGTGNIYIWDVASETVHWSVEQLTPVYRLAWSPDGDQLAASDENTVYLWNVESRHQPPLEIPADWFVNIVWSPDSTQFATLPSVGDNIQVWDAASGATVETFEKHGEIPDVRGVWTEEGLRWLTVDDSALRIWQAHREDPVFTIENHMAGYFSFLFPTGTKLITNYQVWSIDSNNILAPFYTSSVNAQSSPDETCIASAISTLVPRGAIEFVEVGLWSVSQRKQVADFPVGHTVFQVTDLAWSSDGMRLATTTADGIVRIWGMLQ